MSWNKAFEEMWERLWDFLIYPIIAMFGYQVVRDENGNATGFEKVEAE